MPTVAVNGVTSAPDHVTGHTGNTPTYCLAALPTARVAANGNRPIRITSADMYVAGNGASRTLQNYVADSGGANVAASSSFSVAAGSSGSATTGSRSLSKYIANSVSSSKIRFGFENQSGDVWFGRTVKAGYNVVSGADTSSFAGSTLVGNFDYAQCPTANVLTIVGSTSTSASLSWTVPSDNGGSALTGYRLQYSTSATFASGVTAVTTTATSTTVTGLTPGATYYFRVAARNAVTDNFSTNAPWSPVAQSTFSFFWDDVALTALTFETDVELAVGETITQYSDLLSRAQSYANVVKVIYNWTTAAGVATSQMDVADGSTPGVPGTQYIVTNDNTPYPGAGAAAAILARTQSYGHEISITAVGDFAFIPRQSIQISLGSAAHHGTISGVTWDLAGKTMTVSSRNLI